MSFLIDKVPDFVIVAGVEYPANGDFRIFVEFEILMNSSKTESEKGAQFSPLLYQFYRNNPPPDIQAATNSFLWFYHCGENNTKKSFGDDAENKNPVYSFDIDGALLYAAFLDQYRIDLLSVEFLHWWTFKTLMTNLNDTHEFKKAVKWRTIKIDGNMTTEQKKEARRLKEFYRLPDNRAEGEKEQAFVNTLDKFF